MFVVRYSIHSSELRSRIARQNGAWKIHQDIRGDWQLQEDLSGERDDAERRRYDGSDDKGRERHPSESQGHIPKIGRIKMHVLIVSEWGHITRIQRWRNRERSNYIIQLKTDTRANTLKKSCNNILLQTESDPYWSTLLKSIACYFSRQCERFKRCWDSYAEDARRGRILFPEMFLCE